MSKGITERTEQAPRQWEPGVETAPSVLKEDEPTLARSLGLAGASCVIFGGAAILFHVIGWNQGRVGVGSAMFILAVGLLGLMTHAVFDRDLQVRRLYWGLGVALLGLGALFCILPTRAGMGGLFSLGYPCLFFALLFLLAVLHHEQDLFFRTLTVRIIGGAGLLGALVAFLFGNNFDNKQFLVPYGSLLALMSLGYLAAFVSSVGIADDLGYRAGWGIAGLGLAAFLIGLLRSAFGTGYLVPNGLLYMGLGILYMLVAVLLTSENPMVVMTRRELAAYFFSPIMYLMFFAITVVAWLFYDRLLGIVAKYLVPEPITGFYLVGLWPVLTVTFLVPVLTMRLLSEEKRTGSLEVLLTAPVKESTVVLSKFLAAFLLFLLLWLPWWLFLVALRVGGGQPFDYRSLFSFGIAMSFCGAAFVSMGLFFSSLTRNQIAAAVLTFAMMMMFLALYLVRDHFIRTGEPKNPWVTVIQHVDYVALWFQSIDGILVPRFLLFQASATVIWLFLTVKVLEARRWA